MDTDEDQIVFTIPLDMHYTVTTVHLMFYKSLSKENKS